METQIVWCEDSSEWGITNGKSNDTWKRFPNRHIDILKAIKTVHETGKDAIFLLGRGASRTFHLNGTETGVKGW